MANIQPPVSSTQSPITNTDIAINVNNISKCFKLFSSQNQRIKEFLHPLRKKYHQEFWALKDVSCKVKKGETLGIIGRNGSGKSTLLQIICGLLQPTKGTIGLNGTVSALLELGGGFHPEFTGKENVYVNGALIGLKKEEIDKKIHEITEFADIGDYFYQPVKKYSNGMFIRLAFSVAINVDPDILVIDEALEVGDAAFQVKCYDRMARFKKEGKTIVLVSHDTNAVLKYCVSAVLMHQGKIICSDIPEKVVSEYSSLNS